jgi:hypothetical protein
MNNYTNIAGVLMALVMATAPVALQAADTGKAATGKTAISGQKVQGSSSGATQKGGAIPVYVPPKRGAPLARVGGGSRGVDDNLPYISVITPEHAGFTSKSQPVLYWYISDAMKTRFEFALINEDDIDPMVEVTSEQEMKAGLNSMNLADHGVSLESGVSYQWSVALVADANKRSSDIVSSGQIEFLELTAAQKADLEAASAEERVRILAREGYWYDAFDALSELIASDPGNNELRTQRAALLEQIGLPEVSAASK